VADDFERIAEQLYALRPEAFAAARDEQVRGARAAKQPELARELARLRRPTLSAWLINLLWRDQREVLEQYLQLGEALARAQLEASGTDLHRLTGQRRELEAALVQRARVLAEQAGVEVSASMEREAQETLAAALARPEVADEIRAGRLVKPAAYAGFGFGAFGVDFPAAPSAAPPRPRAQSPAPVTSLDDARATAAAAERRTRERREALQAQVQHARSVLAAAATTLAERQRAADQAQERQHDLQQQVDQAQAALDRLRTEVASAERAASQAAEQRQQAQRAHAAAVRDLEQAERALVAGT
jgi:hypothetical protein